MISIYPFDVGHIERKFVEVPIGATWVEVTMKTSGFSTARRFFIDSVQVSTWMVFYFQCLILCRPQSWSKTLSGVC